MDNLSFHITDITANSIRANASDIEVDIKDFKDLISIRISDNGRGMDQKTVAKIRNPFYTTRTTRKVGLGLPFLIQNAEQTGGSVEISSTLGKGTVVIANFISSSIDCPPWGDLAGTMAMLIGSNPDINIHFSYQSEKITFGICTQELKEVLENVPLNHPKVMLYLEELISSSLSNVE